MRNYLNASTQNRITSITYVDPGSASLGGLQGGNGAKVDVYTDASDFVNISLGLLGAPGPAQAEYRDTGTCGHNANCAFLRFALGYLSKRLLLFYGRWKSIRFTNSHD